MLSEEVIAYHAERIELARQNAALRERVAALTADNEALQRKVAAGAETDCGKSVERDFVALDPDNDDRDGVLFRFWIRAASYPGGWPLRLVELMRDHGPKGSENMQPHHFRAALMALAKEKGVNLP